MLGAEVRMKPQRRWLSCISVFNSFKVLYLIIILILQYTLDIYCWSNQRGTGWIDCEAQDCIARYWFIFNSCCICVTDGYVIVKSWLYVTVVPGLNTKIVENTLSHVALDEPLNDPKNGDSAFKHLKQQVIEYCKTLHNVLIRSDFKILFYRLRS